MNPVVDGAAADTGRGGNGLGVRIDIQLVCFILQTVCCVNAVVDGVAAAVEGEQRELQKVEHTNICLGLHGMYIPSRALTNQFKD